MLRLGFPVIGVDDVERATTFWTAALNLTPTGEWASDTWRTLNDGDRRVLALMRSETPVQSHPRTHLDLFVDSREEQEAEVERLVALGAHRVAWDSYPANPDFVVLADPEGNIFCVVDLSHAPST
ncbi:VOC family protein [Amycolatopsis endophytica]|uniref:Catechol 2,3-dioxygenase-like lactoylglutathione lyase family enzyme n=1 Tax=Amycolatopsis endophytica TaxID=860233 RepID=A0A853AYC6_9PSEU|nr:VOC family protein [Amycolatopsis endophytica]NYI87647.1 catechol 2,3-dioxygenase-like lactoylglutathione lyase family enzyme [Amycolatopsis endophytica]